MYGMLNAILHATPFQNLESHWRSLHEVLSHDYHIFIYPVTASELELHITRLTNHIIHEFYHMPGAIPLSLIVNTHDTDQSEFHEIIQHTHCTVFSRDDYNQVTLVREPYSFESCTSLDDYVWRHPIYNYLRLNTLAQRFNPTINKSLIDNMILMSRFIHCIKIQLRDTLGRFSSIIQFRELLQRWMSRYTSQIRFNDNYPFEFAIIKIIEGNAKSCYHCWINMKLHEASDPHHKSIEFKST